MNVRSRLPARRVSANEPAARDYLPTSSTRHNDDEYDDDGDDGDDGDDDDDDI